MNFGVSVGFFPLLFVKMIMCYHGKHGFIEICKRKCEKYVCVDISQISLTFAQV